MTREEFYSQKRDERAIYSTADAGTVVTVPLTRDGFEALVERAARDHNLIIDDGIRSLVAGYLHHVPSNETIFKLDDLVRVVYKTLSNNMTFTIDQECKIRAKKEAEEKANANRENVLNMPQRPGSSEQENAKA